MAAVMSKALQFASASTSALLRRGERGRSCHMRSPWPDRGGQSHDRLECAARGEQFPVPTETLPVHGKELPVPGDQGIWVQCTGIAARIDVKNRRGWPKICKFPVTFPALREIEGRTDHSLRGSLRAADETLQDGSNKPGDVDPRDIRHPRPNSRLRNPHNTLAIRANPEIGFATGGAGCSGAAGVGD